jgi:hypothetical protein
VFRTHESKDGLWTLEVCPTTEATVDVSRLSIMFCGGHLILTPMLFSKEGGTFRVEPDFKGANPRSSSVTPFFLRLRFTPSGASAEGGHTYWDKLQGTPTV